MAVALAACTSVGTGGDIEGVWFLTSYETGDEAHDVAVGVNAEEQPWIQLDGQISGNLGCNNFGGDYVYTEGVLVPGEIFSELAGCFGESFDDDGMMTTEVLIQEVFFWSGANIAVTTSGDEMRWAAGGTTLSWIRVDAPPPEPTMPPQTGFGRLECLPDLVERDMVPAEGNSFDTYRESGQVLIETLTGVSRIEQEDPESLVWFGYDDVDEVIVAVSFDDISPETFSIWTCP